MEKHFAASGIILNEQKDKTLLLFHKKLDKWLIPGGHVEANESPDDAVLREIYEEVGLRPAFLPSSSVGALSEGERQLPTPYCILEEVIPPHKDKPGHIHIDFIYVLQVASMEIPQTDEKLTVQWFSKTEVQALDTYASIKSICEAVVF